MHARVIYLPLHLLNRQIDISNIFKFMLSSQSIMGSAEQATTASETRCVALLDIHFKR